MIFTASTSSAQNKTSEKISKDSIQILIKQAADLDSLSQQLIYENDLTNSNKYNERAISIYKRLIDSNELDYHYELATTISRKANILAYSNKIGESKQAIEEVLSIYRNQLKSEDYAIFYVHVLNNLGTIYVYLQDKSAAELLLSEGIKLYDKLKAEDKNVELYCALRLNLANAYRGTENVKLAIKYYNEVIKLYEKDNSEKGDLAKAKAYYNCALVYNEAGDSVNTRDCFEKTVKLFKSLSEKVPNKYIDLNLMNYNAYATFEMDYNNNEHAKELLLESKKLIDKISPRDNYLYAKSILEFYDLLILAQFKALDKGITILHTCDLLKKEVDELELNYPNEFKIKYALVYDYYAQAYEILKDTIMMEKYLIAGNEVYESVIINQDKNSTDYYYEFANYLDFLADFYVSNNKIEKAIETHLKAIPIWERILENNPKEYKTRLSKVYGDLSFRYILIKKYREAEEAAMKGLFFDENQVWINTNLAPAILYQGRFTEAKELYTKLKNVEYKSGDEIRVFKTVFLKDFEEFKSAGIESKDMEEIILLLKE